MPLLILNNASADEGTETDTDTLEKTSSATPTGCRVVLVATTSIDTSKMGSDLATAVEGVQYWPALMFESYTAAVSQLIAYMPRCKAILAAIVFYTAEEQVQASPGEQVQASPGEQRQRPSPPLLQLLGGGEEARHHWFTLSETPTTEGGGDKSPAEIIHWGMGNDGFSATFTQLMEPSQSPEHPELLANAISQALCIRWNQQAPDAAVAADTQSATGAETEHSGSAGMEESSSSSSSLPSQQARGMQQEQPREEDNQPTNAGSDIEMPIPPPSASKETEEDIGDRRGGGDDGAACKAAITVVDDEQTNPKPSKDEDKAPANIREPGDVGGVAEEETKRQSLPPGSIVCKSSPAVNVSPMSSCSGLP